ncbi:MAG: thymidylate synthase [Candidatus Woesearchaeota archaeon]|jgi:thymidylate synthase
MVITTGNHSCVAIVTLWTKKELVIEKLALSDYSFVGQLYSVEDGINTLLRSLLAHKNIRHIIIVGNDLSGSGEALISFFQKGICAHKIIDTLICLDKEISESALSSLRQNVFVHDYRAMTDFSVLKQIIAALQLLPSYGVNESFPEKKIILPETLPSEKSGFTIRYPYICDAWIEILSLIMHFGIVKKSQYEIEQRELLNLITIIEQENPDSPHITSFFPFTKKDLDSYYPHIITGVPIEGVEYSYGQRLRTPIDQIQQVIDVLRKTPYTRRAIAITWDVQKDMFSEKPPCLILTEFTIQDSLLYLTAFFRSNDMFHAWPRNAFGLRKLQSIVSEQLGISSGSLTVISQSAHIYQNNWTSAQQILNEHGILLKEICDPRGNFVITVTDMIHIMHVSSLGQRIQEFSGTEVHSLYMQILPYVSELSHALYLGAELQRAFFALQNKISFTQDQPF